jgi:nitrogen fixation/metabolism regulation signal transduction histidine kinase
MATSDGAAPAPLLAALRDSNWTALLEAVAGAETWLRAAPPGDPCVDGVVSALVQLATHSKWEIRRRVANVAAQVLHPAFEPALAKLATDDNTRVRQAAEQAALRRRDWQNASALGKQHEDRINSTLDDIEARFGVRGRDAVKRASEQIANTFARELYHEVIKLLSPLALSAERLQNDLLDERVTRTQLVEEAARVGRRVSHLRAVLDAMRAYTHQPTLSFARESLKDVLDEAASLVREERSERRRPPIVVQVEATVVAEVSRARIVQALTNVLTNAVESYESVDHLAPIIVRAESLEGRVAISVEDSGCGMSGEALADAAVLFATSKPKGTGFGIPLAIKIVESEHGGRLSMESTKGRGTVVRVTIPAQQK